MTQGHADGPRKLLGALLWSLFTIAGIGISPGQVLPASVEHVTELSDVVVLGNITESDPEGIEVGQMRQLYTRHTMKVEVYYSGERSVQLRLSKKRYMRGAALEGFKKLESMGKGPNPTSAPRGRSAGSMAFQW